MSLNSNFRDLLSALNRYDAKYLVVGGYAVVLYTEPRYTKDLDIWVEATMGNAQRVFRALAEFGAPLWIAHGSRKPKSSAWIRVERVPILPNRRHKCASGR